MQKTRTPSARVRVFCMIGAPGEDGAVPDAAPARRRALAHVAAQVERNGGGPPLDPSLAVTVHLHPDRLARGPDGAARPLLAHLAEVGTHRSQFETGTSNGGLTAHPGGDRWRWESRLFGGGYDEAPAAERPVYGSLDRFRRPAGGSVRFGSSHLRLAPAVLDRVTFCYPDSSTGPSDVGTASSMPLLALAERDDAARRFDALDDHVEAHVHGGLHLERDVVVVLDPCYRGTAVEAAADLLRERAGTASTAPRVPAARRRARRSRRLPGPQVVGVGRDAARRDHRRVARPRCHRQGGGGGALGPAGPQAGVALRRALRGLATPRGQDDARDGGAAGRGARRRRRGGPARRARRRRARRPDAPVAG